MSRARRRPGSRVVAPRPIPPQLSGARAKRRDAGIARAVRSMAGEGVLRLHTRACEIEPGDESPSCETCTCLPVVLVFGARA